MSRRGRVRGRLTCADGSEIIVGRDGAIAVSREGREERLALALLSGEPVCINSYPNGRAVAREWIYHFDRSTIRDPEESLEQLVKAPSDRVRNLLGGVQVCALLRFAFLMARGTHHARAKRREALAERETPR